jgi:outer membrane protein
MEKKMIIRLVLCVLATVLFTGASYAAELKIGVVDVRAIITKTPQRETIALALQNEFKDRGAEMKALEEEIKAMQEKGQTDRMTMTDQQVTDLTRSIESKVADFQLKEKALQEDFKRRNEEEQRKLLILTKKAIDQVAMKEQLSVVLQAESVAYIDQTLDISNKVITLMSDPNFK